MTDLDATNLQPSLVSRELAVGSIFAERFEILGTLGQGGTAIVYKARQLPMDRIVALKVLHPWLLAKASAQQRFQIEAKALCGLNHPNIVNIYTFGAQGEECFLAMDFLEGRSVAEVLDSSGALPKQEAIEITIAAAGALGAAHAHGIVHRDIKPSNIMLVDADGERLVKVLDFGLAKAVNDVDYQKLTATDHIVGTPYYMSPEQCAQQPLDCRSDIYSLGCVLHEMLSGQPPFSGDSAFAVMYEHLNGKPAPLPIETPTWLQAIIEKMLVRNPGERYQSMEEVSTSLHEQRAPHSVHSAGQKTAAQTKFARQGLSIILCLSGVGATVGVFTWKHLSHQAAGMASPGAQSDAPTGSNDNSASAKLKRARETYEATFQRRSFSPVAGGLSDFHKIAPLFRDAIEAEGNSQKKADVAWEASHAFGSRFGREFALEALKHELVAEAKPVNNKSTKRKENLDGIARRYQEAKKFYALQPEECDGLQIEIYKKLTQEYLGAKETLKAQEARNLWLDAEHRRSLNGKTFLLRR